MAMNLYRVELRGPQLIGMERGVNNRGRNFTEAKYFTDRGVTTGRIRDFEGVKLVPLLQPNGYIQTFVDGAVLERGERVLTETPALMARMSEAEARTLEWDGLTFAIRPSDAMYYAKINAGEAWPKTELVPYAEFGIMPSAGVLNYGQGIFEGMKAYHSDAGQIVLFRPEDNARRAYEGAKRLGLTPVPVDYFIDAVKQVVLANERLVPPTGKGSLYIRPLLIGSGPILGVAPAPENTFTIYVSPVGPYFKGGQSAIKLQASKTYHRAAPGGTGNVKAIGNYAPGMVPAKIAKDAKFNEVLYLDAKENRYIEEVGAANFFCIKNGVLYTPSLRGTILPGITRNSVIQIAHLLGYRVVEKKVSAKEALGMDEAFCTGTAAVISPIGSITVEDRTRVFNNGDVGPISRQLYETLVGIQEQRLVDPFGWVHVVK